MMLLLAVFFGFIVFSLVVLLVISKIADKYLQGDYVRVDEEGDEEEGLVKRGTDGQISGGGGVGYKDGDEDMDREEDREEEKGEDRGGNGEKAGDEKGVNTVGLVDIGGGMVIDFEVKTRDHYTKQRLKEIDENEQIKAQESARLQATLKYEDSTHLIIGCVNNLHNLQQLVKPPSTQLPHEISFHIKIAIKQHNRKYKAKTNWRTFSDLGDDEKLELNFKLGPFKKKMDLSTSDIYFRLYGRTKKSRTSTKSRCYGECCISLEDVLSAQTSIQMDRILLPKSSSKFSEQERIPFSTDSE